MIRGPEMQSVFKAVFVNIESDVCVDKSKDLNDEQEDQIIQEQMAIYKKLLTAIPEGFSFEEYAEDNPSFMRITYGVALSTSDMLFLATVHVTTWEGEIPLDIRYVRIDEQTHLLPLSQGKNQPSRSSTARLRQRIMNTKESSQVDIGGDFEFSQGPEGTPMTLSGIRSFHKDVLRSTVNHRKTNNFFEIEKTRMERQDPHEGFMTVPGSLVHNQGKIHLPDF